MCAPLHFCVSGETGGEGERLQKSCGRERRSHLVSLLTSVRYRIQCIFEACYKDKLVVRTKSA